MSTLVSWWQNLPLNINPVFLQIGPLQIRYYGLMFLSAFLCAYAVIRLRICKDSSVLSLEQLDDFFVWAIAGALVGGRFGYVLFYDFFYFVQNPLQIIWPIHSFAGETYFGISGLSFHGGLLGIFISSMMFCRKSKISLWRLGDLIMPGIALGYTFGRLGNFFNGELFGRATEVPWGMYFPSDFGLFMRHPSQLYEAFFEGIVIFTILWALRDQKIFDGFLFWLYLILYGFFRFFIEFVRQPDDHLGFVFFQLSMGQVLCIVMMSIGLIEIVRRRRRENYRRT